MVGLFLLSCTPNHNYAKKKASGSYKFDLSGINTKYFPRGCDTLFLYQEKDYYNDFSFEVEYDGRFYFSKPFYGENDTLTGTWELLDDRPFSLIILRGKDNGYYCELELCHRDANEYFNIAIPNRNYRDRLPIKKIRHEFPEVCK